MQGIGSTMAILGAGSFVLNLMDREFTLLMWIDNWGPGVGTAIRLGLIVAGGALWFLGSKQQTASA